MGTTTFTHSGTGKTVDTIAELTLACSITLCSSPQQSTSVCPTWKIKSRPGSSKTRPRHVRATGWEHVYFSEHDKKLSLAFLTVILNETQGLSLDVNDVNKQPIFTGVLDNVFVVGSA